MKKFCYIRRGDIYYADLSPFYGSEQGGIRPVLVIQNDKGNRHSNTVIVAAISSKHKRADLPIHVDISDNLMLPKNSVVLLEQIRTIDKDRLHSYRTHLSDDMMQNIDKALIKSLGINTDWVKGVMFIHCPFIVCDFKFIIVSSDSDYTPLVIKLRESSVYVIGVGERKNIYFCAIYYC